ncbi:MAG: NUDIX domain-containing protein [Candidatus Sericytochromatia bacterium]
MSEHPKTHPRVRVAAVVVRGDRLLMVRQRKGENTYWLLPGGGLDYGESIEACARREVFEETGLEIEIKKFLYLSEAIAPDQSRHILNVYVLGTALGGSLTAPDEANIEEVAFVPFADLRGLVMYPAIAESLLASYENGFEGDMRYLGQIWT